MSAINPEITEHANAIDNLLKELLKRHRVYKEENSQLHGLVTAMEIDHKKASRQILEHERLLKDRERIKEKVTGLLEKFEKLKV